MLLYTLLSINFYCLSTLRLPFYETPGKAREGVSALELPVGINILTLSVLDFSEAVQIELPDERREVFVRKVFGQDFLDKFSDIFDAKGVSGVGPAKAVVYLFVLNSP